MKLTQTLLRESLAGTSYTKTNEGITATVKRERTGVPCKRTIVFVVFAVSCLVAGMLKATDVKAEIEERFKDVDKVFKDCESRYNFWSGTKQKDKVTGWLELEKLRGEWRAARNYFEFCFQAERSLVNAASEKKEKLQDGKVSAEEKAKIRAWLKDNATRIQKAEEICKVSSPYEASAAKMEQLVEKWTISLRPHGW